jgi:diguanylate cyclase (GGDEF)-like protein/PAS domain S-box-containing protein
MSNREKTIRIGEAEENPFHCPIAGNISVGVFVYEEDKIVYANPAFFEIFGYPEKEIYEEKNVLKKIAPENFLLLIQYFHKITEDSLKQFHYQFKGKTATGETLFLESWAKPIDPELNPNAVIESDGNGTITYMNPAAKNLFSPPLEKEKNILLLQKVELNFENTISTLEFPYKDRIYEEVIYSIPYLGRFRFYFIDITEKKKNDERLFLANQVFEHTTEGIVITDLEGTILSANPAFTEITGYSTEEVLGKTPAVLKSDRHLADFYDEMWQTLKNTGMWQGEIWNRRKNGEAYLEWLNISSVKNKKGEIIRYIGMFHDITDLKQVKKDVEFLAHHDPLTGLPNRTLLQDRLLSLITNPETNTKKIAVFFLDLDRFKNINNILGHIVGDILLIEVGKRLQAILPQQAIIARIGADDFAIMMPMIEEINEVVQTAQEVLDTFEKPFMVKDQELYITASIGISVYPHDGEGIKTLFQSSDIALHRAKEKSGNQFELYKPEMNARAFDTLLLENHLRKALGKNQFMLAYQPQIDSKSGKVVGVEALIRWHKPDQGMIPPSHFIPLAEETGMIISIGEWVLDTACLQLKMWLEQGYPPIRMAVNLSGRQFREPNILEQIQNILERAQIPPHLLVIEITESITMHNIEQAIQILKKWKKLGVQIAIDDFGTGYSSLNYLKRLPINKLKIDKSFINELPKNKEDAAITNTIIQLSRNLGLGVIAEGVETLEQLEFLQTLGCNIIQGYFYSPALPAKELEEKFLKPFKDASWKPGKS